MINPEFAAKRLCATMLILLAFLLGSCSNEGDSDTSEWRLVWEDNFDGPAGQRPDSTRWGYDIGTDWGNAQLEYDTDNPANAALDGAGNLAIIARREAFMGQNYTSARINTRGLFEPAYGRIEARMQLPWGAGIWPAFWLLGANFDVVGWPACGEIDIMEYRGQEPSTVIGTLHGPGYSGGNGVSKSYNLTQDRFDTGFHVFSVEWGRDYINWSVDGNRYHSITPGDLPSPWVFDHPFYIILNLAVGGSYVGPPDASTVFPQTLLVDWVRVYEEVE